MNLLGTFKITILILFSFFILNLAYAQESAQPTTEVVVSSSTVGSVEESPIETPPQWLVEALKMVAKLPMIGPILTKIFQWAGVLSVVLTLLVAFLLGIVKALKAVMSFSPKWESWVQWLEAFEHGQFMYYLKFLSMFNAKQPVPLLALKK